jgi:hypothetical protein
MAKPGRLQWRSVTDRLDAASNEFGNHSNDYDECRIRSQWRSVTDIRVAASNEYVRDSNDDDGDDDAQQASRRPGEGGWGGEERQEPGDLALLEIAQPVSTPRYLHCLPPWVSTTRDNLPPEGNIFLQVRQQRRGIIGMVVIHMVVVLSCVGRVAEGCEELDVPYAAIEIVPTECNFWRQAGLVRQMGSSADKTSGAIQWERDCGLPTGFEDIRFSTSGEGQMGVGTSLQAPAEPLAVSDLGSQTQFSVSTCGKTESTTIESIFRTWTNPAGAVLDMTSLEYATLSSTTNPDSTQKPAGDALAGSFRCTIYYLSY